MNSDQMKSMLLAVSTVMAKNMSNAQGGPNKVSI